MTTAWQNFSPGDLRVALDVIYPSEVEPVLAAAAAAARHWARTPLPERIACLVSARAALAAQADGIARLLALEVGKPIVEARAELAAVLAKVDLSIDDALHHCAERSVSGGPHPAWVRQHALGPAVVIGPFNFPLHLPHGAHCAHLLAGNPVIFKPSPVAASVSARYADVMRVHFPEGVFQYVQGTAHEGMALATDPRVRAVVFTGSVEAGRALAVALAPDYSKSLALELGGKNAALVCADADLEIAAAAVADGMCLTCGQRCNATSRVIVASEIADDFLSVLQDKVSAYQPGDPLHETTRLGPLATATAYARYAAAMESEAAGVHLVLQGGVIEQLGSTPGYYVRPTIRHYTHAASYLAAPSRAQEVFAPLLDVIVSQDIESMAALHNAVPFGLTASIFTRSKVLFESLGSELAVGNLYANLPTTFSPSTLPFGGWAASGNGKPAGRGFVRFATQEQSIQIGTCGFEFC